MRHIHGFNGVVSKKNIKTKQLFRMIVPEHVIGHELCSYILLDLGGFIPSYSVISVGDIELKSEHIKQICEDFMINVESKIGNYIQAIFDGTKPEAIYLSFLMNNWTSTIMFALWR